MTDRIRVLLVDDDEQIRELLLASYLLSFDIDMTGVADGAAMRS